MTRIIIFLLQLLVILFLVTLIFTNPFVISLDIKNFKYSFSSNLFAAAAIVFILIIYILNYLIFKSRLTLNNYIIKSRYGKLQKGYFHFVDAMIAIANKDNRNASKSHKKMNKYLKDDPSLSLLLESEVYKIEKKYSDLNKTYEQMIKSNKTEALGYRGLMELNLKNQDYHHAFLYGEKLFDINPFIEKLYDTLLYIIAKTRNWNQLILITDTAYSKKIINKETYNENKAIGFYEIAKIKSDGSIKEAIKNIVKAIELKKDFPPFIKLYLELISKSGNLSLLKKNIRKYWYSKPTSTLRSIISRIIINNNLSDLSFINQVIKNNNDNEESKKLLIYFAIQNENWKIAREKISGLIGSNPSKEICIFMANIELGEHNDKQKSDSWLMRSENSLSEDTWVCKITNQSQQEWNSLSKSGYFNSLVLSKATMLNNNLIK